MERERGARVRGARVRGGGLVLSCLVVMVGEAWGSG